MKRLDEWLPRGSLGAVVALALVLDLALGVLARVRTTSDALGAAELTLRALLFVALAAWVARLGTAAGRSGEAPRSDPSTGLANTRVLFEHVASEIERAQRYERSFTLAYVGIDSLPARHDRAGRDAEEETLRRVAHQIRGSLRTVDVVARLRGREFAVLLPETGPEAADIVLGRVQRGLNATVAEEGHPFTFAVGATTWVRADLPVDELHQRTYQLMYEARYGDARVRHQVLDGDGTGEQPHRHLAAR